MKLVLKRDDNRIRVSLAKADPKDMPKMQTKVMGGGGGSCGSGGMARDITFDGDPVACVEIGVVFAVKSGKITVADVLPLPGVSLLKSKPKNGDRLASLQNQTIATAAALQEVWDKIAVGDSVNLVLQRGDQTMTSRFVKPRTMGQVMIQKGK